MHAAAVRRRRTGRCWGIITGNATARGAGLGLAEGAGCVIAGLDPACAQSSVLVPWTAPDGFSGPCVGIASASGRARRIAGFQGGSHRGGLAGARDRRMRCSLAPFRIVMRRRLNVWAKITCRLRSGNVDWPIQSLTKFPKMGKMILAFGKSI